MKKVIEKTLKNMVNELNSKLDFDYQFTNNKYETFNNLLPLYKKLEHFCEAYSELSSTGYWYSVSRNDADLKYEVIVAPVGSVMGRSL